MHANIMPVGDTYISRHYAATNFSDKEYLSVGLECWRKNINIYKSLLKFDIPQMPAGSELKSAVLRLFVKQLSYADNVIIRINVVSSCFDADRVTWAIAPSTIPTNLVFYVNKSLVDSFVDVDISELFKNWIIRKTRNVGIALTATMDEEGVVSFASTRNAAEITPKIITEYSTVIGPAGPPGPPGPAGPPGPPGPAGGRFTGFQAQMSGGAKTIGDLEAVKFDTVLIDTSTGIGYDSAEGKFIITQKGDYYVYWWVATEEAGEIQSVTFGVKSSDGAVVSSSSPAVRGLLSGGALIDIESVPCTLELANFTGGQVTIPQVPVQANIVILQTEEQ